jgi:hypothetical protein
LHIPTSEQKLLQAVYKLLHSVALCCTRVELAHFNLGALMSAPGYFQQFTTISDRFRHSRQLSTVFDTWQPA